MHQCSVVCTQITEFQKPTLLTLSGVWFWLVISKKLGYFFLLLNFYVLYQRVSLIWYEDFYLHFLMAFRYRQTGKASSPILPLKDEMTKPRKSIQLKCTVCSHACFLWLMPFQKWILFNPNKCHYLIPFNVGKAMTNNNKDCSMQEEVPMFYTSFAPNLINFSLHY